MIFPENGWSKYISMLSAIDKTAARKFSAFLDKTDISTQKGRQAAIDYAYALATQYGEMAAAAVCEMYDVVAEASKVFVPAAEPAPTPEYGEVAKTFNGMVKQNQSSEAMGNSIGRLVKRTGADTALKNALRDGAEFAWVPHGDTCSFCLMLASNGWQKASKKTIKGDHAEHIHANCDCTFAIRFDGKSSVGGYDPDKYREMYENAEGDTWEEKLNSMRRTNYAENADKIRAQKRKAYERNKTKKDIDKDISILYNNAPQEQVERLYNVYKEDVEEGWISALCGFDNYLDIYYQIEDSIVGTTTSNGIVISGQSRHFMQRVIGTSRDPKKYKEDHVIINRSGVSVDDIAEALKSKTVLPVKGKDEERSQVFVGEKCKVSVNPDTGKLIQCNPRSKK